MIENNTNNNNNKMHIWWVLVEKFFQLDFAYKVSAKYEW